MEIKLYPGKTIGVAVSGGADSMCLLHRYYVLGQTVNAINIEHGIRGESSRKDSEFVKEFCKERGIPFMFYAVDSLREAEKEKQSVELAARNLRYRIFDQLLKERRVDIIAVAHHADDNVETVLMRAFRGTGVRGMRGIIDRPGYIHPFLPYTKEEILTYAKKNHVNFVEDESNKNLDYTRNYIRNRIMPAISRQFPSAITSIQRLIGTMHEVEEYLTKEAAGFEREKSKYLVRGFFLQADILKSYSIRDTLAAMGILQDIEERHVRMIAELRERENHTEIDLFGGIRAFRKGEDLAFYRPRPPETITAKFDPLRVYFYMGASYRFVADEKMYVPGSTFDMTDLPENAVIRTREEGDMFKRVNGRTKLLSDFLNEKKLDPYDREEVLCLAFGKEVYAVLGVEVSDKLKLTEESTYRITVIRSEKDEHI